MPPLSAGEPKLHRAIVWTMAAIGALAIGLAAWWAAGALWPPTDAQAERFVRLGLKFEGLRPREAGAYFGPAALYPSEGEKPGSLPDLHDRITALASELDEGVSDERRARLHERATRLAALVAMTSGDEKWSFDEEAKQLYGLEPAALDEAGFAKARAELDQLLPGEAPLASRVEAFRERFIVPVELRPVLFERALDECRSRTMKHWPLPPEEKLYVEWNSYAGAAWHQYQGNYRSSLQISPQAVAFLGSVTSVACHEGYPGHHVHFLLREQAFGKGQLPLEDKIVFLRSPGSVVREGAADYGVSLVFPDGDRLAFERDVLFPLAHFPPEEAEHYAKVRALLDELSPAALPILRDYRDRRISPANAVAALKSRALISSPGPLLDFTDNVGAFVTGYTGVREQVRAIVERGDPDEATRWNRLRQILGLADELPLGAIAEREEAEDRTAG